MPVENVDRTAADADDAAAPTLRAGAAGSCYYCGVVGHKGRDCPKRDADLKAERAAGGGTRAAAPQPKPKRAVAPALDRAGAKITFGDSDDDDGPIAVGSAARSKQAAPTAGPAASPKPAAAAQPSLAGAAAAGACKHCGSTEHLSRQCRGAAAGGRPSASDKAAASPLTTATSAPQASKAAAANGVDACKFCGSGDHLSRRCPTRSGTSAVEPVTAAGPAATPKPAPRPVKPAATRGDSDDDDDGPVLVQPRRAQPAPIAETPRAAAAPAVSTGGLHNKPSPRSSAGAAPTAAVEAAARPVAVKAAAGGDACKFCGSTDHLSRQCKSKTGKK